VGSEESVEQSRGPMDKHRIRGLPGRTSELLIAKSTVIKDRGGRSGGRAVKAVGLTSGDLRRSCSTTGVDDAPGRLSITLTAANLARSSGPKPNWMRQRNTMLVAMSWWRQTAATMTPGCSASITIASFSSSAKLRRFDRRSRGGSPGTEAVKPVSADRSLAALLTPLLILGRALG
jgi:hypothetical protein